MWLIRNKPMHLTHASGKLFKTGVAALARRILDHDSPDVGVPPFDQWSAPRQLACLAIVAREMLSPRKPTTFPTLWTDGAVAAAMAHVEQAAEGLTHFDPDLLVPWARLTRKAYNLERGGGPIWQRPRQPGRMGIRWMRQRWTTLDWRWMDDASDEAAEQWQAEGHGVFDADVVAALPDVFFSSAPPDPSTAETQEHEAYLRGLMIYGRKREVVVPASAIQPAPARAQRRVKL